MNWGLTPPPKFFRRDVDEYDRRMEMAAAAGSRYGHGSSSSVGSSSITRAPLPPSKREEEEQHDRPPRAGLLPGDFADEEDLPWIIDEVIQRSKEQQQELDVRRHLEEELDEILLEKALEELRDEVIDVGSDSDFDWSD